MSPAVSPPHFREGVGGIEEGLPLSPVILDPVFNDGHSDNIMTDQLPPPPPPPPPTQLSNINNTYPRTSTLLRERAFRHPPRIPRLRRFNHPNSSGNTAFLSSAGEQHQQQEQQQQPQQQQDYFVDMNRYNRYIQRYNHNNINNNHNHNCIPGEKAVDLNEVCGMPLRSPSKRSRINGNSYMELEFEVSVDDGGQYSASYGVENILRNDCSVYCSGRSGAVNILLRYNGFAQSGIVTDKSCVVTHIVIKSPQYGFTAPCKDGVIFMSRNPIDVERSRLFDQFTKEDFEHYMSHKAQYSTPEDDGIDPIAWFTLSKEKQMVIPIEDRSAKYILVKLLRSEFEADNIDLQYLGFVGYSGPRCFARGRLC